MSATEHLQRRLFYKASELADFIAHDDVNEPIFRNSDLFQQQIYESKGPSLTYSGLRADIEKNGVQKPVRLHDGFVEKDGVPTIMDGHHRIAIANDVNPDMYIAVEYVNR